ncbi:MAG: hypothetical protein CVU14_07480 [Bacteroidetes bacterium HGW-Bacteroidetes-9]|nr:MAG: hypothetical protein CVU14_07480 [Bacteroidetes bacterium HGW-Bacteroidetes-9]
MLAISCKKDNESNNLTPTLQIPIVSTFELGDITQTAATCGGDVTSQGTSAVTVRGVCWSMLQNPTTSDSHSNDGSGTGSFTSKLTGLIPNTSYYVRAYATNSEGTAYGSMVSFSTLESGTIPSISTDSVTNVAETTALCGGNITSDGGAEIIESGVCWDTLTNPTVYNAKTIDGTSIGSFLSYINGLLDSTQYFVRAYATNSCGTGYGSTMSFTTLAAKPPTIDFISEPGFVSNDITLAPGSVIKIGVIASSNGSSSNKLVRFRIVRIFNNVPVTQADSAFTSNTFNFQFTTSAQSVIGSELWLFTITDTAGKSSEISLIITTGKAGLIGKSINNFQVKQMKYE